MPDTAVYWDANVFLSYINGVPERLPTLDALLESSASGGGIRIYTSTLSVTEVAFATSEQKRGVLDPAMEQKIDSLWEPSGPVTLADFHIGIGRQARDLMRGAITNRWSLKPYDANHLATAQWLSKMDISVDEFHTYDDRLVKYGSIVGFKIVRPYISAPKLFDS